MEEEIKDTEVTEETQVSEVKVNDDLNTQQNKPKRISKIYTGIAFGLVWFSILLAIIMDLLALKDVILTFIGAIIISAAALVIMFVAFIISIIFVFGFYLLEEHGFWPVKVALNLFKDVLGDIHITANDVQAIMVCRMILIGLCLTIIVLAIIGKSYLQKEKEQGLYKITENTKELSNGALWMGSIGIAVSLAVMAIVGSLQV